MSIKKNWKKGFFFKFCLYCLASCPIPDFERDISSWLYSTELYHESKDNDTIIMQF